MSSISWGPSLCPPLGASPCPTLPRLLQELAEKEQEWQQLMQRALRSGDNDTVVPSQPRRRGDHGEVPSRCFAPGQDRSPPSPQSPQGQADPLLLEWLQRHDTDPATTATVRPVATWHTQLRGSWGSGPAGMSRTAPSFPGIAPPNTSATSRSSSPMPSPCGTCWAVPPVTTSSTWASGTPSSCCPSWPGRGGESGVAALAGWGGTHGLVPSLRQPPMSQQARAGVPPLGSHPGASPDPRPGGRGVIPSPSVGTWIQDTQLLEPQGCHHGGWQDGDGGDSPTLGAGGCRGSSSAPEGEVGVRCPQQ